MIEKKKNYLTPEVKVIEIEQTDMICQSPKATFGLGEDNFEEEEDW